MIRFGYLKVVLVAFLFVVAQALSPGVSFSQDEPGVTVDSPASVANQITTFLGGLENNSDDPSPTVADGLAGCLDIFGIIFAVCVLSECSETDIITGDCFLRVAQCCAQQFGIECPVPTPTEGSVDSVDALADLATQTLSSCTQQALSNAGVSIGGSQ